MEEISFVSLGYVYHMRLAKKYVTKKRLESLFAVDNMVLITREGDEVEHDENGLYPDLSPVKQYMVVDEKDLDDEEEEQDPHKEVQLPSSEKVSKMLEARREMIRDLYKPLHPHLYTLSDDLFVPSFIEAIKNYRETKDTNKLLSILTKETETGIYSFNIFNDAFCKELIEEVENFEGSGLPVTRPNSMNNYGVILDEIGFKPFFDRLTTEYMLPFTTILFPTYCGATLDAHHAFIVQYKIKEDLDLDFHYDSSEVTLNLCLGKKFEGGSLYFAGLLKDPSTHNEKFEFDHVPGRALLHIGKHRHGANKLVSGERYNLIVWFADSKEREKERLRQQECQCGHEHGHSHGHNDEEEEYEDEDEHDHEHSHGHHDHEGHSHGHHDHHEHEGHSHSHSHHDHEGHSHGHHDHHEHEGHSHSHGHGQHDHNEHDHSHSHSHHDHEGHSHH